MATNAMYMTGFERAAITDVTSVGANASRNTTSPISGSADLKMAYPSGSTTWNTATAYNLVSIDTSSFRKATIFCRFKFDATPAADAVICTIPGTSKTIAITTNKKLKVDTTELTFVMSINTVYQLEVIADKDWTALNNPLYLVKLSDNSHSLQDSTSAMTAIGSINSLNFGNSVGKAATGPAVNIQVDDLVGWASPSITSKAIWLNQQTIQTIKVPTANGTYNDFVGVGSTTNKYANEDEDPSNSTTDFNFEGQFGVIKRNTTTTWALPAGTYNGWMLTKLYLASAGQDLPGDVQQLLRENGVDYTSSVTLSSPGFLSLRTFGSDTLPDGTILAGNTSRISAMESGMYVNLTYTTYNSGYITAECKPTADGTTYDGVWTQTGGTGGSAYTAIDEGVTTDGTDYITSTTLNDKQGLKLTWNISPLTSIGDVVYSLHARIAARTNAAAGSAGSFKVGVRIGGVDYLGDNSRSAAISTTTFTDYTLSLTWSTGNRDNPNTAARWTKSDIENAEWYIQHTTVGSGNMEVANFWLEIRCASSVLLTTQFMDTIQGDTFTNNGLVGRGKIVSANQAVNRSNTY